LQSLKKIKKDSLKKEKDRREGKETKNNDFTSVPIRISGGVVVDPLRSGDSKRKGNKDKEHDHSSSSSSSTESSSTDSSRASDKDDNDDSDDSNDNDSPKGKSYA
jgi:hypothetical protein